MNEQEFKLITHELQPALLLIARKIIGDEEEAKDVVQDSLLRLWLLKEEVQNIRGFARILVRNRSLDVVRKRQKHVLVELKETDYIVPTDEHDERIDRMMALVENLPTMQQTVLRLRHMEGKEMSEIAELMRSPESGFVNTSVEIIPFRGKMVTVSLNKAIEAFNKDSEKGYNFRKFNGATIGAETFGQQMKLILNKRQELLDKMHKIILEETN